MGNTQTTIHKINHEDVQRAIRSHSAVGAAVGAAASAFILINTLPENEQDCLLPNTTNSRIEEDMINTFVKMGNTQINLILYGRNCNDVTLLDKYTQLSSLGFCNLFVYSGGMFEWLMLQDVYGEQEFPTTKRELDILKYKPQSVFAPHGSEKPNFYLCG